MTTNDKCSCGRPGTHILLGLGPNQPVCGVCFADAHDRLAAQPITPPSNVFVATGRIDPITRNEVLRQVR
jgi:hypothetical protein